MKKLEEYETPETDAAIVSCDGSCAYCSVDGHLSESFSDFARGLERKLAMCRDALRRVLDCIQETRGKDAHEAVYFAQETLVATSPTTKS